MVECEMVVSNNQKEAKCMKYAENVPCVFQGNSWVSPDAITVIVCTKMTTQYLYLGLSTCTWR